MHYEVTTLYTKEQKDKMVTLLNQQGIRLDQNLTIVVPFLMIRKK